MNSFIIRLPRRSQTKAGYSSFVILTAVVLLLSALCSRAGEPLRALLITGGCCHDYEAQKKILTEGISARANVTWTIIHEGDSNTRTQQFSIYQKPDWAKGFDVVVHNECSGFVSNVAWVEHIAKVHAEGVPAVVIHCSIHSYRYSETDEWRKLLGVSSYRHQKLQPFEVETLKLPPDNTLKPQDHPIMKGFPMRWQDGPDELYEIKRVWPDCTPLAVAITPGNVSDRHPCIWINKYGKARVFGTTLGHGNDTMRRPEYLDLVTRGLLWACGKLD